MLLMSLFSQLRHVASGRIAVLAFGLILGRGLVASAQHEVGQSGYAPRVAEASDEGEQAIARFKVPTGLAVSLFAAEPRVAQPVAFAFDSRGRVFVAETFRHSDGVTDTRGHMNWLDDDLACRSVDDRVIMYRKFFTSEEFEHFGQEHERVRLIEDRDGDGRADFDSVFADGFNRPESGIGAGVLPWKDGVFYTCIPDLWWLKDTKGNGRADERVALSQGYGVHVGFLGHDLHGLIMGPDGRLYFSIGDRGINVTTIDGRHIELQDTGSVLRCEPDGSRLEVVHMGLRNPQELAFDDEGNLFTVDNNSDGGDKARLVHIVPGGDSGWRIGWQFIENPNPRGPWNSERMWEPRNASQPAYQLPPLANISDGPSGLAFNPGTALRPEDRGRFFLADFRGSSSASGVRSFRLRPEGASFALAEQSQFLWGLCATDVAFGPDGGLYVSDWVEGWDKTGKGRIYGVDGPGLADDPARRAVKADLARGMSDRKAVELEAFLDHDDYRLRQAAQFEIAERLERAGAKPPTALGRDAQAAPELQVAADVLGLSGAASSDSPRARRHAVWAVAQLARRDPAYLGLLTRILAGSRSDRDVRLAALRGVVDLLVFEPKATIERLAGQGVREQADAEILAAAADADPQLRFWGAIGAGHLASVDQARATLTRVLTENAGSDPYLTHAAVMGLGGLGENLEPVAVGLSKDSNPAVRMAAVLALRRAASPELARFLTDTDAAIVLETARAINDLPVHEALAALAALPLPTSAPAPLARRVLNANVILGNEASARALAMLAGSKDRPEEIRAEAIDALASWAHPQGRDRVTGLWRKLDERSPEPARAALSSVIGPILEAAETPVAVAEAAARAAGGLRIGEAADGLTRLALENSASRASRSAALRALAVLRPEGLLATVKTVAGSTQGETRSTAIDILAEVSPAEAIAALKPLLATGTMRERQAGLDTLARVPGPEAAAVLTQWLDQLRANEVPAALRLELCEALAGRPEPGLQKAYHDWLEAARKSDDVLAPFRNSLEGGDSRAGSRLFFGKTEVYCQRCHRVNGKGGEVGPDLSQIGKQKDREYVLRSIVLPNHEIAEGFETRVLALDDGQIIAGIVKKDDGKTLTLVTPEARVLEISRENVEDERRGDSAMPADLVNKLSARELRDLVEFLSRGR